MSDAIHRDDLDYPDAEAIVRALQAEHPGCKVVFAGDAGDDLPEEVRQQLQMMTEGLSRRASEALAAGRCFDCGARIPGDWPPEDGKLPEGWSLWEAVGDGPEMLECPECGRDEGGDEPMPPATEPTP